MNLMTLDAVSKTQGNKTLFEALSFGLEEGDRVALIGVNGCGKSTLLKIMAGFELPDGGTLSKNRQVQISFLNQNPDFNPEDTVMEHILKGSDPKLKLIARYEECTRNLEADPENPRFKEELQTLMHQIDSEEAWEYERQIRMVLEELGIDRLSEKMSACSGGMLKKIALAQALMIPHQLLILDEPTNHLDIKTIQWLENYLSRHEKSLVMVTHDRYFLDRVCNKIIEIHRKKIFTYKGNYRYYLEKKAEQEAHLQNEQARTRSLLRNELAWLAQGIQGRGTRQKARLTRAMDLKSQAGFHEGPALEISASGRRLGNQILELEEVSFRYGKDPIIENFSYTFQKGQRLGIIGPNGCGKSTLLNLIAGNLIPAEGKIEAGINTCFGFYDQNAEKLNPEQKIIDFIKDTAEVITLSNGETLSAGKMLERFLFAPHQHYALIETLSGGERRRLYLLHILMKKPNFLLLDEPTNDLDIQTLSILEDFLEHFNGCVLMASHDRYLMDRLCGFLLVFKGGGKIELYTGNYSEYLKETEARAELEKERAALKKNPAVSAKKTEPAEKKKLSFNEKKELDALEGAIEALESEKALLEDSFHSGAYSHEKTLRHEEVLRLIEAKMQRWEELSSRI